MLFRSVFDFSKIEDLKDVTIDPEAPDLAPMIPVFKELNLSQEQVGKLAEAWVRTQSSLAPTPEKIKEIWLNEGTRANTLGNFYHNQRESDLLSCETLKRNGVEIPIIKPIYNDGIKHAPEQRLTEGIYPEHFVYLKSAGLCGQSDRVEVVKDTVDIIDYKTNKEIKKESYKNWEGISQKMTGPLAHLDDCNFNHYAVQLSLYLYII